VSALSLPPSHGKPSGFPRVPPPEGMGILPLLAVGAVVGGGAWGVSALSSSSKKKRRKRRARAAQAGQQQEVQRRSLIAGFTVSMQRIETMRRKVAAEVRQALRQSESLARYSAQLGDLPEFEQFVAEVGGIQASAGELTAALADYDVVMPRGDEPAEFFVEIQPQIEAGLKQLKEIGREARLLLRNADRLTWKARELSEALEQKRLAEEVAERERRSRELEEAAREDHARRARVEAQRDLVWERQLIARREWNRDRRRAIAAGKPDPGPWRPPVVEDVRSVSPRVPQPGGLFPSFCAGNPVPSDGGAWICDPIVGWTEALQEASVASNGMSGWFSDLFGADKKKAKKRAKRAQQHAQAAAEQEKSRRATAAVVRGTARLKQTMREINNEAVAAAGWVARIRRMVNETPDLPVRLVDESLIKLEQWEGAINEVRVGVGDLDLGVEDPETQRAYLSELQAALAAIRTVRIRASALRETIEAQVKLANAHEIKVKSLLDRQRELTVREKVLAAQAGGSRRALEAERSATRRAQSRRAQAEQARAVNAERQRLAERLRFLRQLERRHTLVTRARGRA
jgi:hypothetical protein